MFERKDIILETERLYLREMNQGDFHSLCKILQDDDTMYAYEGAFSDEEVQEWLDRQVSRYRKWNFGLWAVILKALVMSLSFAKNMSLMFIYENQ